MFQEIETPDITGHLWLKNVNNHIHERAYRNRPLNLKQEARNKLKSKVRSRVDHIFGYMTNSIKNGLYLRAIGKKRIDSIIALLKEC